MSEFPEHAAILTDSASRRDKLAAWDAAGRLLLWLQDLRNQIDPDLFRKLVWEGAACNRWFDIAELLASGVAVRPDASTSVRRLHCQMLMERGFYDEALRQLRCLLQRDDLSDYDRSEALGHIGRIHKDRFVAARRIGDPVKARKYLQCAIEAYLAWYTPHGSAWHGINAVALLSHPDTIAIDPDAPVKARRIAQEIINNEASLGRDSYKKATLAEAYVALGDFNSARQLMQSYVSDASTSGFHIGNLHRQLTSLWELDRRASPWPELIAMIASSVLEHEGAVLHLSGEQVQRAKRVTPDTYQAVFGADRFDSYENYRRGLDRCTCVARIGRSAETGIGTGFIVPGKALHDRLGEEYVLVTNAHVVSDAEELRDKGALHPAETVITFAALDGVSRDQEFGLTKILFTSPPAELDVTVLALSQAVAAKEPYPVAPVLPTQGSESRVRVIGHPSGRGLSISVNALIDHQMPKLHYKTATEGGSSGSPVFNQSWQLIGLHHAGGEQMPKLNGQPGTYQANEGICILEITKAMNAATI